MRATGRAVLPRRGSPLRHGTSTSRSCRCSTSGRSPRGTRARCRSPTPRRCRAMATRSAWRRRTWRGDGGRLARANLARRRVPKPHVRIKYLEGDFAALFLSALAGLMPDGTPDAGYRGRELARNAVMARLALATGLRRREFTFLLVFEVPPAPPASHPAGLPVLFPVPAALAKGCKYRTTWIDAATLHAVHGYAGLYRAASVAGSVWSPPPRWGAGERPDGEVGVADRRRAAAAGCPGRGQLPAGGARRRGPVHRVGERVHPGLEADPGAFRAAVPAGPSASS